MTSTIWKGSVYMTDLDVLYRCDFEGDGSIKTNSKKFKPNFNEFIVVNAWKTLGLLYNPLL